MTIILAVYFFVALMNQFQTSVIVSLNIKMFHSSLNSS